MELEHAPERVNKRLRLLQIIQILRGGHYSVHELARKLYPNTGEGTRSWLAIERAIQRDLGDLEQWEPLFQKMAGRPPRYHIPVSKPSLHPTEALVLHAAARLTYHRAGGENLHHLHALNKLGQLLPERVQVVLRRSHSDVGQKRGSKREGQNLEHVATAWLEGHPLRFEYQKPNGSGLWRTNVVEPYLIEAHPQNLDLYLIGKETSFHGDLRTFKLSRMKNLQVQRDQRYSIPETFDPKAYFVAAWGVVGAQGQPTETIHLRFRADAADRILEGGYAHLSQPVRNPDGTVETTLEAALDGSGLPREALPWIYSFGPRVEVLGPARIREHWLGELREAVAAAQKEAVGESA